MVKLYIPYIIITKAIVFLNFMLVNKDFIPKEPNEMLNNAGNVPKPKLAIISAPDIALPLAKDHVNVEYTKPQGNQPHIAPRAIACLALFIGINLLLKGDK